MGDRLRSRTVPACVFAASLTAAFPLAGAPTVHRIEPGSGIESWETHTRGVNLRLTQILPDQVRGFYLARGFDAASVERLATGACVFQTVLRNESVKGAVAFNLADWRIVTTQGERPLTLEREWQQEWEQRGVPAAARTAFRYAFYPTEHRYEPGDWNMGMTAYALPLGSRFDLRFVWSENGARREAMLRGVRCAKATPP